jgi:ankyrin repeat protein
MLKRAHDANASKKPGREDLEEILRASFTSYDLVFCHLDALDECPEEEDTRRVVLQGIEQLFEHAQNLRILVTSRDESDIRRSIELLDLTSISVASELVTPDIQRYIDKQISRVPKLSRLDAATKTLVRETLSERADGMFRYVFCQLQELTKSKSTRPTTVRNVLLALPATLDGTYERMLSRIDFEDQPYALTLLRWLAFSYEPLTLEQLAEASIIDPTNDPNSDGTVDIDNKGDWADTLEVLAGLVVAITDDKQDYEAPDCEPADEEAQDDDYSVGNDSASSPSSRQIHEGTKVRLAHFSVKEYLQSNRITASKARDYHLDPGREHRFLTHSCLAYLIYYSDSPQKLSSEQDLERFPLLHYAAKRWWNHASEQTYENTIREVRFLTNDTFRHDSLRVSRPDTSWQYPFNQRYTGTSEGPALPFACYSNLYQVVQGLIAAGEDIEAQHDWLGAALHVAAHAGGEAIVRLLVDAGANVNLQGCRFCRTALQAAAINGHEAVVCLLLSAGADVNLQIAGDCNSALQAAAINGHETIIRLLLDAGADVNLPGGQYGSALQAAANRGHKAIVRLLLDAGADINLQGGEYDRTTDHLLIDAGADVNPQGGAYGSTLQAAAVNGHEAIVQLLLDAGADVNLQGGAYGSALQAAAVNGHEAIIQLLLDAGADVNLQGGAYGSALQAAARQGHEAIIQLLLDVGADVNIQGGAYGSALQAAARQGHEAAVRSLLDAKVEARRSDHSALHTVSTDGVVMEVKMFSSETETGADVDAALRVASEYGYERIVHMLLKAGADANTAVRYDMTALQAASSGGYGKIVQMLLDAGADAAQVDESGRSALVEALGGGHETVVQILGGVPADASEKEQVYGRALIIASGKGDTSVMQSLLKAGADAMFVDGRGRNALVEASNAYVSHEDAMQLLLDATADVHHEEIYGKALVAASLWGHTEVVRILLNAGADPTFIDDDDDGRNALVGASGNGHYANVEVVQLLLDATANVPREEICRKALGKASRSRNPEVRRMLLDAIVNAPMSDATYREALIAASKFGHTAIVGRLLEAMPPAALPEEIDQEALLNAARQGHADIKQVLNEASADLSHEGNHHEALIQAVNYGHTSVVRLLLEKAPIVLRQGSCQEALIKAAEYGHLEIVQILLEMTPNVAPEEFCRIASIEALAEGQDKVVQMLSKQFGHAPDQNILCSALIRASEKGRADMVQSLLTATMDAPHEEAYRKVLVNSMLTCDIPFVRLLLDAGADVNDPKTQYHGNWNDELFEPEKDEFSLALHAAACTGVSETVKMLLDAGADVHARDHNGYSALHLASQLRNELGENGEYEEIVQMLLDAGADFNF